MKTLLGIGASWLASRYLQDQSELKVNVIHCLPGRIRLGSTQWKNQEIAASLEQSFQRHPLIKRVVASPITGSLLIEFHVAHLTEPQFDEIMQQAVQITMQEIPKVESALMKRIQGVLGGVDNRIKTRSMGKADLNSLLVLFLTAQGLLRWKRNPTFATSLLLWSYGLLTRKDTNR